MICQDRNEIVEYSTVTKLANAFSNCSGKIEEHMKGISVALNELNAAFRSESLSRDFSLHFEVAGDRYRNFSDERDIKFFRDEFKRTAWRVIVDKIGIRSLMSSKRQKELKDILNGRGSVDELPEISEEAIFSMLEGMANRSKEFLDELLKEEMDWLLPRGWQSTDYKTNQVNLNKLTPKLIKCFAVGFGFGRFRPSDSAEAHLMNVDNIFHMLDGKGMIKGFRGPLVDAINATEVSKGFGETAYFRFRAFRNGNLHLWFKRIDLVEKFNSLVGGDGTTLGGRCCA